MTKKTHLALDAARKLGIAIVATGVLTISGGVAAPQDAKAWGIGDAFDFVEDVWEIGADATERAGRAIGEKAQGFGRGTITPTGPRRGRRVTGKPVEGANTALPPSRGSSRPSTSLPPSRGTSSNSSLPTGNTALPPARGESASSNSGTALPPSRGESSGNSLPTGNTAMPPARGQSTSNNSGRALPPPRRRNERVPVSSGQRPTPITEEDVKPPFCNSKFENCSGHHGQNDKIGEKGHKGKKGWKSKHGGKRNKSVRGNPTGFNKKKSGNKRTERKLRIKRDDGKMQNRRGKKITVKYRTRTQMKRNDTQKIQIKRSNAKRTIRVTGTDRRG